jgi:acyl-CoA thioesterase
VSTFAEVTEVTRRGETGVYDVTLHPDWAIVGKPNGGYLLAALARAGCAIVGNPHPLAVSGHFLRAPAAGPAEIHVETVRKGRQVSTARATLWQDDKACLAALVTSGALSNDSVAWGPPPPAMPAPEDCVESSNPYIEVEIFRRIELRVDPVTSPFPTASGEPVLRYWFRLRDGADPDVIATILATDCGPPTVFNLEMYGWAPTVELTVLLRGLPAAGWLCCETRSNAGADGWFDEEATVWDSTGRVVAQARQLAMINNG